MMKLSVIIPVYNEENLIKEVIQKVKGADIGKISKEIIIVDDFSKDRTREVLKKIKEKSVRVIFQDKNYGKGYAIRTALKHTTGDIVLIQDADLEYNPNEYSKLLNPIIDGKTKVVYGSRNLGQNKYSYLSFYVGGRFLTWLANFIYGINITDEATCYKVFKREVIQNIPLKCERFEFCPEITAKVAMRKYKIIEVPISYNARSKEEGKKIKWKDGVVAIWTLIKFRFID